MATHVDEVADETDMVLPPIQYLTAEETLARFDDLARTLLGVAGAEFVRRLDGGFYDDVIDDPDHSDVGYLAMLADVVR